jgi:hypothetical protein
MYFAPVKQYIAYIFITIFSFQVLPVKELGNMLFKGQITEEKLECGVDADDCPDSKVKKEEDPKFHSQGSHNSDIAALQYVNAKISIALHLSEVFPLEHVPDVLTPPPNC